MCVGPGPGVKLVLAARRRCPDSSKSSAVSGGRRESVFGWISGGSVFWAFVTRVSAASNKTHNRTFMNSPHVEIQRNTNPRGLGRHRKKDGETLTFDNILAII